MCHLDSPLQDAWVELLSRRKWDAFLTITFRTPRHPWHAISTLNGIQKSLEKFGCRAGFLGTEQHVSRLLHVHGVVGQYINNSKAHTLMFHMLKNKYGRSKVSPMTEVGGVLGYVTKYCTKGLTEYTIW